MKQNIKKLSEWTEILEEIFAEIDKENLKEKYFPEEFYDFQRDDLQLAYKTGQIECLLSAWKFKPNSNHNFSDLITHYGIIIIFDYCEKLKSRDILRIEIKNKTKKAMKELRQAMDEDRNMPMGSEFVKIL